MYVHAAWYGAVMVVLAVWNLVWQPDYLWFVWPLVGWGLGVASHALAVFGVFGRGDRRDTDDAGGSGS